MSKIKSDAHLYITEVGAPDPAVEALTSITKATPPVVTPVAMPSGFASGDFAVITGTGEEMLDGYAFRAQNVTATTYELADIDGTKFAAAISGGSMQPFTVTAGGSMSSACMAQITVTGQAPDSINLDDMCSTETVLGDPKPPTFTFSGFVDNDSAGFHNLVDASVETPKPTVWALFDFSPAGGYIFGPAQIGELTVAAGTKAGLQFSGAGVFTELPTYSWAL
jgi:hypothetical protein